jgi:hypothetical protein
MSRITTLKSYLTKLAPKTPFDVDDLLIKPTYAGSPIIAKCNLDETQIDNELLDWLLGEAFHLSENGALVLWYGVAQESLIEGVLSKRFFCALDRVVQDIRNDRIETNLVRAYIQKRIDFFETDFLHATYVASPYSLRDISISIELGLLLDKVSDR